MKTSPALLFFVPRSSACRRVLAGAAVMASCFAAFAQVAPSSATPKEDEPLQLSPFNVSTSRDVGFVATSALAGGRLASDLKDTPVAYSVQTREFIDALNLTNVGDAANWVVNGVKVPDDGRTEVFGTPTLISFRGGAGTSTGYQRDFFRFAGQLFAINYDSYNLERYDYARGPNAVLFGASDISGTTVAITRKAQPGANFGSAQLSVGSWDNYRTTLDVNRSLSDNLAVRVDAVWQDRGGWRRFEMERKKAAQLDLVWRYKRSTEIRAQAEVGSVIRNNPLFTLNDRFTGWDGSTVFSTLLGDSLPTNANAKGYARYGSSNNPVFVYAAPWGGALNIAGMAQTLGGNATGAVPVGGLPVVGPSVNANGQPFDPALNLPATTLDRALTGSNFRRPDREFAVSSSTPTFDQDFRNFSLFANHRFSDALFFESGVTYARERRLTTYTNTRELLNSYIDINQNLPDGRPNPKFLSPYSEGHLQQFNVGNEGVVARASLAYLLQNTKWGDFSFNVAYEYNDTEYITEFGHWMVKRATDPRLWATQDPALNRFYWDEPSFELVNYDSVSFKGVTYPAGWVSGYADFYNYTTIETIQASAKAKLLQGRLHLLAAARVDDYLGANDLTVLQGDLPLDWDGHTRYLRPKAPADYATLTYVPKDASGNPTGLAQPAATRPRSGLNRLPQYANDRFQDDYAGPDLTARPTTYTLGAVGYIWRDLALYANYSTSFNPNPARQNITGAFNSPQKSKGWETGLRQTLAEGRLAVSLGYYTGELENQSTGNGIVSVNEINAIINASPRGTATTPTSNSGNIRGVQALSPLIFDVNDRKNSGWELELTANPTPGWRVSINAALPKAYQSNTNKFYRAWWAENDAVLRQVVADAGVLIDAQNNATVDLTVPSNLQSPNATAVANGWNNNMFYLRNALAGPQLVTRLPKFSANLFTDYECKDGPLQGLTVGGGINYRGKQAIGYRGADTIVDPSNPAVAIDDPTVDAFTPVYADSYYTATAVLGYRFRLGKHPVAVNLTVDNLLDNDDPMYYATTQRPVGGNLSQPARTATPSTYYYLTPRNYTLSATLKF